MAPGGRFTIRRPASKVSTNPTMTDHIAMPLVGQTSNSATPIDHTVVPSVGENSNSTTPHGSMYSILLYFSLIFISKICKTRHVNICFVFLIQLQSRKEMVEDQHVEWALIR